LVRKSASARRKMLKTSLCLSLSSTTVNPD
jgi:hypothetical protein